MQEQVYTTTVAMVTTMSSSDTTEIGAEICMYSKDKSIFICSTQ